MQSKTIVIEEECVITIVDIVALERGRRGWRRSGEELRKVEGTLRNSLVTYICGDLNKNENDEEHA